MSEKETLIRLFISLYGEYYGTTVGINIRALQALTITQLVDVCNDYKYLLELAKPKRL
jgi:hypothetical protein